MRKGPMPKRKRLSYFATQLRVRTDHCLRSNKEHVENVQKELDALQRRVLMTRARWARRPSRRVVIILGITLTTRTDPPIALSYGCIAGRPNCRFGDFKRRIRHEQTFLTGYRRYSAFGHLYERR
jgi:hypothetical protein